MLKGSYYLCVNILFSNHLFWLALETWFDAIRVHKGHNSMADRLKRRKLGPWAQYVYIKMDIETLSVPNALSLAF